MDSVQNFDLNYTNFQTDDTVVNVNAMTLPAREAVTGAIYTVSEAFVLPGSTWMQVQIGTSTNPTQFGQLDPTVVGNTPVDQLDLESRTADTEVIVKFLSDGNLNNLTAGILKGDFFESEVPA